LLRHFAAQYKLLVIIIIHNRLAGKIQLFKRNAKAKKRKKATIFDKVIITIFV